MVGDTPDICADLELDEPVDPSSTPEPVVVVVAITGHDALQLQLQRMNAARVSENLILRMRWHTASHGRDNKLAQPHTGGKSPLYDNVRGVSTGAMVGQSEHTACVLCVQ